MFERFTRDAHQVVVLAEAEARRLGHQHLGTEHLLMGILAQRTGRAARTLTGLGVTAERVEREVVSRLGRCRDELGPTDAEALRVIGIDLEEVRRRVEAAFGQGALQRSRREGAACAGRNGPRGPWSSASGRPGVSATATSDPNTSSSG